jgi:beta-lactamase superfamily II metal-dependent hydrolase
MEVYFVDIGKGTSNLILLGQSRAIVVDCGKSSRVLLHLLKKFQIQEITRLVVSHNHDDHAGGAPAILTEFRGRIEKICFLEDGLLRQTTFWEKVEEQRRAGIITYDDLVRLECENRPRMLYQERPRKLSLKIFSPRFGDNLQAVGEGDPNATSAVLVLAVEDRRVVFAGDSTIRQWQRIRQARGSPVDCEILSVAHHAGIVWNHLNDLQWLYREGVKPRYAIVSVSTSNTDGHPRPEVIHEITSAGVVVVCTQITRQCCDDLEPLRPGVLAPLLPGRSMPTLDLTGANHSRNVGCGGTMVAEFVNSQLTLHRVTDHQDAVNRMAASVGGHPLCR